MTRLFNEPAAFADEMIEGFVASHGRWVKRVSGGVVRNTQEHPGHGGAGDRRRLRPLPGLRRPGGPGPGARRRDGQPLRFPLRAADLQRGQGRQQRRRRAPGLRQLRRRCPALQPGPGPPPQEGIDCRSIAVTDDVSSAPLAERAKRRGIAGDLTVFKVAAAAAEAGYPWTHRGDRRARQRPHPFLRRRVHRLHPARRGPPAVLRP